MSHYLLEYSGEMFPVAAIPIVIIYNMVHDFQVSGSASAFCQGPQSHVRAVDFSRASVPSWPRRETTRRRGGGGGGGARSKLE